MSISRVAVVGAGVIGVALAREITRTLPAAEVTVFDRSTHVAAGQSGHTAGIVDAGLAAEPGTTEAELARRGVELLVPFLVEHGLAYRECGQLVVAQDTAEVERLEELAARAEATGVPGIRLVDRSRMREIEPKVRGVQGLYSPHTAITDFAAVAEALAAEVRESGGRFRFSTEVTGLDVMSNEVRIRARTVPERESEAGARGESGYSTDIVVDDAEGTPTGADSGPGDPEFDDRVHDRPRTYHGERDEAGGLTDRVGDELRNRFGDRDWFKQAEETLEKWTGSDRHRSPAEEFDAGTFDLVLVAAGLRSDRLAVAAGLDAEPRIVPFSRSYSRLGPPAAEAVHGIISSVPDPAEPFEETILARTGDGELLLGTTTHLALGRDGGSPRDLDLSDLGASFGFSGFWKFAKRNVRAAAESVRSVASTSAFVERLQCYVPELDAEGMAAGPHAVSPQAIDADGELVTGLVVTNRGRLTQVRNVPACGATSALAIAEHVVAAAVKSAGRP